MTRVPAGPPAPAPRRRLWTAAGGAAYIAACHRLIRWRAQGREHLDTLLARNTGFICSVWHGRLFMMPAVAPRGRDNVAVISNNRDGDLIADIVARFGIGSVRGSTHDRTKRRDKGGRAALVASMRALRTPNTALAITPDGPRGPRMRAQIGVAALSVATGTPVLPFAFSVRWATEARSWDRFLVPWSIPFAPGALVYGPVLYPPESGDHEAFRRRIEEATTAVTRAADRLCGRTTPDPAPLPDAVSAPPGRVKPDA